MFAYTIGYPNLSTVILILDSTTLVTVASTTVSGCAPALYPSLFTLSDAAGNKNLFLSFANAQGNNFSPLTLQPPYFSQVYQIDVNTSTISLVDQVPLPKFAESSLLVRANGREALICHGGFCSIDPSLPNIYEVVEPLITCDLPGDCDAIRILRFDGKKLSLVVKQPGQCCCDATAYPPADGSLYFVGQSVDIFEVPGDPLTQFSSPQEFWSIFKLEQGPSGLTLRPQNGPFQDMKEAQTVFSKDGQWMLRTGSYGYFNDDPYMDSTGVKNVLLFKVSSNAYRAACIRE